MDSFEKYINSSELYDNSPSIGHMKRFEEKIEYHNNIFYKKRKITVIAVAASIIVLFGISFLLLLPNKAIDDSLILVNETKEYYESELYFQNIIEKRIATIEQLDIQDNYINELNDLDDNFQTLKEDLKRTPGDQRVINAVISTYMLKIETLDKIVTVLKKTS